MPYQSITKSQEDAFEELVNKTVMRKGSSNKDGAIFWDKRRGLPGVIYGLHEIGVGDHGKIAVDFVNENRGLFYGEGIPSKAAIVDSFDAVGERRGLRGTVYVRLRQSVGKYPVWGSTWKVHLSTEGAVLGMSGSPVPIREADLPQGGWITEHDAMESAKEHHLPNELMPEGKVSPYVLMHEYKPHYVWVLQARGIGFGRGRVPQPATLRYFVDAISGDVLRTETVALGEGIQRMPIMTLDYVGPDMVCEGSGIGIYCTENVKFSTRRLQPSSDNPNAQRYALANDDGLTKVEVYVTDSGHTELSTDDDNQWDTKEQAIDVDAYVNTIRVKDYFNKKFNRGSFFNDAHKGKPMIINAIRGDGNTQWDPRTRVVNVALKSSDGQTWGPLCDLDVVAHEWTHALLSDERAILVPGYVSASSALKEALCDAFAQFITNDPGWVRGRSVWKRTDLAEGSRNMRDPTNSKFDSSKYDPSNPFESLLPNGAQPDHMSLYVDPEDCTAKHTCKWRKDCTAEEAPCWPSHINQGIINKATYLMAQGGVHSGKDVRPGMGVEVLEQLYYESILNLPEYEQDFDRYRDHLLNALYKLYGPGVRRSVPDEEKGLALEYYNFWKKTINRAFAAVGVIEDGENAQIVKPKGVVHWPKV